MSRVSTASNRSGEFSASGRDRLGRAIDTARQSTNGNGIASRPAATAVVQPGRGPGATPQASSEVLVTDGPGTLPAARAVRLMRGTSQVAVFQYHLTSIPYCTMQILHVEVAEGSRRQGLATRLFDAALADARAQLPPGAKLRRVYTGVPHKSVLNFRALLTRLGFHHVSTTPGLIRGEDLLIYIKSYT